MHPRSRDLPRRARGKDLRSQDSENTVWRSIRNVPGSGGGSRHSSPFGAAREPAQLEADARAAELLISRLDEAGRAEADTLRARGKRIPAVRHVRELTHLPLADDKRLVEALGGARSLRAAGLLLLSRPHFKRSAGIDVCAWR